MFGVLHAEHPKSALQKCEIGDILGDLWKRSGFADPNSSMRQKNKY
jgi:hypothetical protein